MAKHNSINGILTRMFTQLWTKMFFFPPEKKDNPFKRRKILEKRIQRSAEVFDLKYLF